VTCMASPTPSVPTERSTAKGLQHRGRGTSGFLREMWGLYPFRSPLHCSSLVHARSKQTTASRRKTQHRTRSTATDSHCCRDHRHAQLDTDFFLPPINLTSRDANVKAIPVAGRLQPRNQTGRIKVCLEDQRIVTISFAALLRKQLHNDVFCHLPFAYWHQGSAPLLYKAGQRSHP